MPNVATETATYQTTVEDAARRLRDWIHGQPLLRKCSPGSDECPDLPLAYELARIALGPTAVVEDERYKEIAGDPAPEVEQRILHQILQERDIRLRKPDRAIVLIRSHARRMISFDFDDFPYVGYKREEIVAEFEKRRAELPEEPGDERVYR